MDRAFWVQVWREGRIRFHRDAVNDDLLAWSDRFLGGGKHQVLVPLCGKSLDLLWLRDQGHDVTGVELANAAVRQLHDRMAPEITRERPFTAWRTPGMTLLEGDFFEMDRAARFDRIWDRAALVAVEPDRRAEYAALELALLRPGGRILLVSFAYDAARMDGPPFSVPEDEVRALYAGAEIEVLEERDVSAQIAIEGHDWFWLTAYLISAV